MKDSISDVLIILNDNKRSKSMLTAVRTKRNNPQLGLEFPRYLKTSPANGASLHAATCDGYLFPAGSGKRLAN